MPKQKSPYLGYSLKELNKIESNLYVLHFGGDFFCESGYYLFTKKEVEKIYKINFKDLTNIVKDGNEKDKKYAADLILGMHIKPVRIH